MAREDPIRLVKPILFLLCLLPLALLGMQAATDGLGANPIETITRTLGDWALRLLLVTLAVTPLRRITGWQALARLRRMLGLFAFAYACLHLSSYVVLDQFFDWGEILADIRKRPYITLGATTFLLLVPLAATSTDAMMRRLGGRRWRRLHRLAYAAGVGGVLHFFWLVKADLREPAVYGAILALLLGYRLIYAAPRQRGPRRDERRSPSPMGEGPRP